MRSIIIKVDKLLKCNASRTQDQARFNQEYNELEQEHLRVKKEAESFEKEIEDKIARKIKIECAIKAYKHSNFVTEFSEGLWTGLHDKYLVFQGRIECRRK